MRGLSILALGLVAAAFPASGLGVLVPAYFYPAQGSAWDTLNLTAQRVPLIAIMNPNNGPATTRNDDYSRAVTALRNAGGLVIGYVYSSYKQINRQTASNQPPVLSISLQSSGATRVDVTGAPGRYVLQSSSDSTGWQPTTTNVSATGTFSVYEAVATNRPVRLHRAEQ